ncbi:MULTISPECIES: DMT family transporter [Gemella]|uniref:DMT family transporter n=1 Tax=Gemella TaxID=1378 RepID=UPI000AC0C2C0|nr:MULTISPECIES: DMT family transporter [Gemella]
MKCRSNILMGIFCIVMAGFGFALMALFVKLSGDLPSMQKAFFRNLIAAFITIFPLMKHRRKLRLPSNKIEWSTLIIRAIFGTIGLIFNFYAISHINLADASIIQKLSPFIILILSYFVFKERMTKFQVGAIVIAFIGILFVIKPNINGLISKGAAAALMSALGTGVAYTCVRYLGLKKISGEFIILFFSVTSTLMLLPYLIFDYHEMSIYQISMLLFAGISASIGQFGVTFAYRFAPAKNIAVFDYSQVLFAGILGIIFLGEFPDFYSLIGYCIVILIGIVLILKTN